MTYQQPELLTEEQIERRVERQTGALNRALLRGDLDQSAYNNLVRELDVWTRRAKHFSRKAFHDWDD